MGHKFCPKSTNNFLLAHSRVFGLEWALNPILFYTVFEQLNSVRIKLSGPISPACAQFDISGVF